MINVNIQSSIKITGSKTIYFDPLNMSDYHDADYIFITHTHYDHLELDSIKKIVKEDTIIIGPEDIKDKIIGINNRIICIKPLDELNLPNITVKGLYSYNKNKTFHKKENNWLGYYLVFDDKKYYIAGDTDALDENKNLDVDIAFVPIGGTYTMDYNEAADFVNEMKPKEVIPIHYGMVVGSRDDFLHFKGLVKDSLVSEYIKL